MCLDHELQAMCKNHGLQAVHKPKLQKDAVARIPGVASVVQSFEEPDLCPPIWGNQQKPQSSRMKCTKEQDAKG